MKLKLSLLFGALFAVMLLATLSCSKKDGDVSGNNGPDSTLVHIGNDIILPAYRSLSSSVNALDAAVVDFNAAPDATKLGNVQSLFKAANVALESASQYDEFGPASDIQPNLSGINLFPANTVRIDSNIASGNLNINVLSNLAAKGFPALDYLLFSTGSNTLLSFTTDASAAQRRQYLTTVSSDIKTDVTTVLNAWEPNSGNYLGSFVNGTGNSVSSSLGLLINSMVQDLEILKNDRFGIPLGKQSMGGQLPLLPKEVEAYYSGISMQLAVAQLRAFQQLYLGVNGKGGLQDYLVKVNAQYKGGALSDTIRVHFEQAVQDMSAIPDPFSVTIQNNAAPANAVYAELQQLVVLLKTDMPSSLGVLITFGDNDGD